MYDIVAKNLLLNRTCKNCKWHKYKWITNSFNRDFVSYQCFNLYRELYTIDTEKIVYPYVEEGSGIQCSEENTCEYYENS